MLAIGTEMINKQAATITAKNQLKQVYIEKKSIPMIALWCPAFSNHG